MKLGPLTLAALIAALSVGCASGAQRRANAKLRDARVQLQGQVEALARQVSERDAQIAALSRTHPSAVDSSLVPQVAALSISSESGLDPSPVGDSPVLQILVDSVDGRNRPVQLAGTLEVQVLRPRSGNAPELVGLTTLEGPQLRDAWRGGLLGVHWLVEVPLHKGATLDNLLVHVRYVDVRTGRALSTSGSIRPSGS